MKRLWIFARVYWRRWSWGFLLLLLTNATAMLIPQLFRFAVDGIWAHSPAEHLSEIALTLIVLALGGTIFRVRSRVHIFFAARDVEMDLRCAYYAHLTQLDADFYTAHRTGDLLSRATNDLTQVRLMLGPGMLNVVNTAIAYAAAIPLMMLISVKLTAITLAVYPPSLFLMRRLARMLYVRNRQQQDAAGAIAAFVQENLAGAHVVRAFGIESERADLFERRNGDYYDASLSLAWVRSGMFRLVMTIANATILVAVVVGARDAVGGELTVGDVVALAEYVALLAWPTFALGWVLSVWQRGAASMSRIAEILDTQPSIRSGALRPTGLSPSVQIRDLSISYGSRAVLQGVDVTVEPGKTLGIVGPIGSGKSTLVRAMMRLSNVAPGCVFIGEHDVTDLDLTVLRGCFGYVPQVPGLFSKSLADNVAFGMPEADHTLIREALAAASFNSDLEVLPDGLHTPVGERGITLSGGQKQRTALARALIMNPAILVLDDALSAVDTETEAEILAQLRNLRRGRTSVIVAHRISAVSHADEIIVLDAGRVVERGTHAQLVEGGGLYATMAHQQELLQRLNRDESASVA